MTSNIAACLCILAASVLCIRAETYVYEQDFDTGIPGVHGHSVVTVHEGKVDLPGEVGQGLDDAAGLLHWALNQFDRMTRMDGSPGCTQTSSVLLVNGVPLGASGESCDGVAPTDIGITTQSLTGYATEVPMLQAIPRYEDIIEEHKVHEERKRAHYVRRIMQISLMVICAVTLFLCIQQARELSKPLRNRRAAVLRADVTSKTPLLTKLPPEGPKDITAVVVGSLHSKKPSP